MKRGWMVECADGCGILELDTDELSATAIASDHHCEDQSPGGYYLHKDPAAGQYHKTVARPMRDRDWAELDARHARSLGLPVEVIRRWRHDAEG